MNEPILQWKICRRGTWSWSLNSGGYCKKTFKYSSTISFSVHSLSYLSATMGYLLGCLRGRERERPAAFISLGLLAVAVGPAIKKYLPKIMEVIKASLPTKVCFQDLITLLIPFIWRGSARTGKAGDISAAATPLEGVLVKGQGVIQIDYSICTCVLCCGVFSCSFYIILVSGSPLVTSP